LYIACGLFDIQFFLRLLIYLRLYHELPKEAVNPLDVVNFGTGRSCAVP